MYSYFTLILSGSLTHFCPDQGNAEAQYILAYCYCHGEGVDRDLVLAVEWYRKSGDQGNADAQFSLGNRYCNGEGVDRDLVLAVKWYLKAADQGDIEAQMKMGHFYLSGTGVLPNTVEAIRWFSRAAHEGCTAACNKLDMGCTNGAWAIVTWTRHHHTVFGPVVNVAFVTFLLAISHLVSIEAVPYIDPEVVEEALTYFQVLDLPREGQQSFFGAWVFNDDADEDHTENDQDYTEDDD